MAILGLIGPGQTSGSGNTQSPPPPPPPDQDGSAQTSTNTQPGSTGTSTQTTGGTGEGSGTTTITSTQQTQQTGTTSTSANTTSRPRSAPTPVDAPAVRADFSADALTSLRQTETEARRAAIEAQESARVSAVLETLAQPVKAPTIAVDKPETPQETASTKKAESGPPAFNETLKTLRGQDEPSGKVLDRAA